MLLLKDVNKFYGNFHALKDINLFIEEGEFVSILGESGSGKSTLLNIISGLDDFSSGEITINGITTKDFSKKDWAIYRNNYVGFVFQEYNLIDHLTIVENVELPLLLQGESAKKARSRALEKLKSLGLLNHANKLPKKVSGGQQQRAAIARALVTEPKVILADEPTGALDSENAKIILDILKVLSKDHVVILVTHDEEFAYQYSTRVVTLDDGKIISDTNIKETSSENTTRLDLKRPNMKANVLWKFAKNNLSKRIFRTFFTSLTMSIGLVSIFLIIFLIGGIKTEVKNFVGYIIPKDQYYIKSEVNNALLSDNDLDYVKNINEVTEAYFQYRIIPLKDEVIYYGDNENTKFYERENYELVGIPTLEKNFLYKTNLVGSYPKGDDEVIITSKVAEILTGIQNINEKNLEKTLSLLEDRKVNVKRVSSTSELNESYKIVGIIHNYSNDVYVLNTKLEKLAENITDEDIRLYYNNDLVDKAGLVVFFNTNNQSKIEKISDNLTENGLVLKNPVRVVYGKINNFFDTILYVLLVTSSISLLVSGILVGLIIYISVIERIKEIGILTSLGARGSNIRFLFIFESGFIGFLSSFIALVLSLLITFIINGIFNNTIGKLIRSFNISQLSNMKLLHINGLSIVIVFGVSILYAILCGLIPAILASRLNAVEALRKE